MKAVLAILLMSLGCYGSQQLYDRLCEKNYSGFLRHPEDCHKFIRCSHQRAYVFHCPADLWWHHEIESCDFAYRTQCKVKEFDSEDQGSETTTLWVNFKEYKEESKSKREQNLTTDNVNVTEEYLQSNVNSFTESKLTQPIKRNFTAKFYYVKKLIKDHGVSYATTQNSIENFNSTLSADDAVKLTDARLIVLTDLATENTKDSGDYLNLKENSSPKENKIVNPAANCSKNTNRIKNVQEIVAVKVTESILTNFPKRVTEINKNLNSSTASSNSTMLKELTDAADVIKTTETLLKGKQEADASNNLNLTEFETVNVTEEEYTTEILTNSLTTVNATANSTVNIIKVLEPQTIPVKCSCLTAPQLKVLTENPAAITESSVKVSETTTDHETQKKTNSVTTENTLYSKSSIESSTTTTEQNVTSVNSPTLEDLNPVKITDNESVTTPSTTDKSNYFLNLSKIESEKENYTNNRNISTVFAIQKPFTNNAVNLTEVMVTDLPEDFKLTQIFCNKTKHAEKINVGKSDVLNTTPLTVVIFSNLITDIESYHQILNEEIPITTYTTTASSNSDNKSKKTSHFAVIEAANLTELESTDFMEDLQQTPRIPDKTNNMDLTTATTILAEVPTTLITELEREKPTSSDNSLKSTENYENSTANVKHSHQNFSPDNIHVTESILTAESNNSDILTEVYVIEKQLTVQPNVNLTEHLSNNSLHNNSDILTYFNLTVNSPVKATVKPNVNITANEENLPNTFNSTENSPKINNSVIFIDSYSTDIIPVKVTVQPNVNLTENSLNLIDNFKQTNLMNSYSTDNIPVNLTVKLNVNFTVDAENLGESLKLTENSHTIDNSEISIDSFVTDNSTVKLTVKPNVNLTENTENLADSLNLTEKFHSFNNSDFAIDSFVTDNSAVKLTVQPNVNLTVNVDKTTNTFNSNTETINDLINSYNLTEKSTDIIVTTVNLTEKVTEHKNSTFNSLDKTENSMEYVTKSFTETTNIDMVTEFAVNITREATDATVNAFNTTDNSLANVKENLTFFSEPERFTNDVSFTESLTVLQSENYNNNNLTDIAVNITVEPLTTEIILTESTKEHVSSVNLTESSTASTNTIGVTEFTVNLTVNVTAATVNFFNSTESLGDTVNHHSSINVSLLVNATENSNIFSDFNKFNTISNLTENSLQNVSKDRINELITEFMLTASTKDVVNSINLTETLTEPTDSNRSTDLTVKLTDQFTVYKATTVSSYNISENSLQNLPKDKITDLPLRVNVTTEISSNSLKLSEISKEFNNISMFLKESSIENVTATREVSVNSNNLTENFTTDMLEDSSVKMTYNTNRTNNEILENTVNITDTALTENSVKTADVTDNSVNKDNFTESPIKEVSVKTNDDNKENVTRTETIKENDKNSDQIVHVTEAMLTEEENSVNITDVIKTMLTEESIKTTDEDDNNLNRFAIETTPLSKEYKAATETVKTMVENSVNIENVTETMLTVETVKESEDDDVNKDLNNSLVKTTSATKQNITATKTVNEKGGHAVKITEDDFSIQTTPVYAEKITPTETVKKNAAATNKIQTATETVNKNAEHSVNVTESIKTKGTVKITEDEYKLGQNVSDQTTAATPAKIIPTETIKKNAGHSVNIANITVTITTEGTVKTTEDNDHVSNQFTAETNQIIKDNIATTETVKENLKNDNTITEGTVKITDHVSNQFSAETIQMIKDNIATTESVKENIKNLLNIETITESTITELTLAETVTNIVNHYRNKTTTVIKENANTMKTDILEENLTENLTENSQKNVTNIMLTSYLTESPKIEAITRKYSPISSTVYSAIEILKNIPAQSVSTTLTPATTPPELYAVDITTLDPRLPFRSIECVGSNNRRQFQASECYQYYQCFAGWAFLLNCHEGWRFESTEGQCILDSNKECVL